MGRGTPPPIRHPHTPTATTVASGSAPLTACLPRPRRSGGLRAHVAAPLQEGRQLGLGPPLGKPLQIGARPQRRQLPHQSPVPRQAQPQVVFALIRRSCRTRAGSGISSRWVPPWQAAQAAAPRQGRPSHLLGSSGCASRGRPGQRQPPPRAPRHTPRGGRTPWRRPAASAASPATRSWQHPSFGSRRGRCLSICRPRQRVHPSECANRVHEELPAGARPGHSMGPGAPCRSREGLRHWPSDTAVNC
jgi:hypothetical protein